MVLETPLSAGTHDMTFDGTPEVIAVYSDAMVTRECLVTLTFDVVFDAVANCEDVG